MCWLATYFQGPLSSFWHHNKLVTWTNCTDRGLLKYQISRHRPANHLNGEMPGGWERTRSPKPGPRQLFLRGFKSPLSSLTLSMTYLQTSPALCFSPKQILIVGYSWRGLEWHVVCTVFLFDTGDIQHAQFAYGSWQEFKRKSFPDYSSFFLSEVTQYSF